MNNKDKNTKYLVGHYIIFGPHRKKEFHVDYTHDNIVDAVKDWEYLCGEFNDTLTEIEIRKQTTETIIARELDNEETMA